MMLVQDGPVAAGLVSDTRCHDSAIAVPQSHDTGVKQCHRSANQCHDTRGTGAITTQITVAQTRT